MSSKSNKYQEWLADTTEGGNYFIVPRKLYKIMPKLDAMFLADLTNMASMPRTKRDSDNWFLCTSTYLSAAGWTPKEQKTRFASLKSSGLIETARRGNVPQRWICLNLRLIDSLLQRPEVPNGTAGDGPNGTVKKEVALTEHKEVCRPNAAAPRIGTTEKEVRMFGAGLFDSQLPPAIIRPASPSQRDYASAERLHDAVATKANLRRRWNRAKWARELSILRNEVGDTRMEEALAWYCANIKGEYVPESFCGESFRKKFPKIEAAMRRGNRTPATVTSVSVCATQIAKRLLSRYDWGASAEQLAPCVQLTIDRMAEFRDRCRKVTSPKTAADVAARIAKHLTASVVEHLAEVWVADLNALAGAWKGWDGNLMKLAWDFRREPCQHYLRDFTESYFGVHSDPKRQQPFGVFLKEYRRAG